MSNNMMSTYDDHGTATYAPLVPPVSFRSPSAPPSADGVGGFAGGNSPVTTGIATGGSETVKRKRGRPRKYATDDSIPQGAAQSSDVSSPTSFPGKRARGRPPGSRNKQKAAASGTRFMPHILDVGAGEDVLAKLTQFSQNSTRTLCILSAIGSISSVTLQQPTSGGTITYEGNFEILSLSGLFMPSENGSQGNKTGLCVALSGPDGRVLGGNVSGLLTVASSVQVVVGSFMSPSQNQSETVVTSAAANHLFGISGDGNLTESSGGSPVDENDYNNPQGMPWR